MSSTAEASNQAAVSSVPVTAIIFAVISTVLYFWLLKPLLSPPDNAEQQQDNRANNNQARVVASPQRRARQSRNSNNDSKSGGDIATLLEKQTRCPPHMAPAASYRYLDTGGISLLSEGILPFRHGRAAAYEQALAETDSNTVSKNRKDRARVLSRVLALDGAGSPPSRGSTIVVSIPSSDVGCEKLRRALYLLSTHFNAMLILSNVSRDCSDNDIDAMVATLRGTTETDLPEEVLPRHRIVAARSMTGRIAFARQLARVEFLLDFDENMKSELGRFGFRVLVYPTSPVDGVSGLGYALLS